MCSSDSPTVSEVVAVAVVVCLLGGLLVPDWRELLRASARYRFP
jgi:hypothetical protein